MNTPIKACLLAVLVILGCGSPYRGPASFRNSGIQDLPAFKTPEPGKLESLAYSHFGQKDYVRALRYAYQAFSLDPTDPRLLLLMGLIYDRGFDRPDLAVKEYGHVLSLVGPKRLEKRIGPRIRYLYRKAQLRAATRALTPGQPPPLKGQKLAIFPFRLLGGGQTHRSLTWGLQDIVLYDLQQTLDQIEPFRLQALCRAYLQTFPEGTPSEYAVWAGADLTLTGQLIALGDRRIRLTLTLLDPAGQSVYTSAPITGHTWDLADLRYSLLNETAKALEIPLPASLPEPPIGSPITLMAYLQGRNAYLEGNLEQAHRLLSDAQDLEPQSDLIAQILRWVENDLENMGGSQTLVDIYWELLTLPDPDRALSRRLQATHDLTAPAEGEVSGTETHSPFKPPHPETTP